MTDALNETQRFDAVSEAESEVIASAAADLGL
jgi:hypothetical protein